MKKTVSSMHKHDAANVECILLKKEAAWSAGIYQEQNFFSGQIRGTKPILSLDVSAADEKQKEQCLEVLKSWDIDAFLKISASEGNREVIRVQGTDCTRLELARFISNPQSWVKNSITTAGREFPLMNLCIDGLSDKAVEYMKEQLVNRGITATVVSSRSLSSEEGKSIDVLRVEETDISKLRDAFPLFRSAAIPSYPEETHYTDRQKNGNIVIRKRVEDGVGKIDNPIGPAVCSVDKLYWFLDGINVSEEDWQRITTNPVSQISNTSCSIKI